jgi:hypothetical protein
MDQQSILLYLARKRLTAVAIIKDLVATPRAEAISYLSITRCLRDAKFATSNPEVTFSQPMCGHDDCDQAMLLAFDEHSFASLHQLARLTHLPRATVRRRVTQSLGFQVCHLRWVPYRLLEAQKSNRVEPYRALRSVLRTQQVRHWQNIITLDESRFYLNIDYEST